MESRALATTTKKERTPQAVRSATMQRKLAKAAFEVIRDVGYANFRFTAVAKHAGVSHGAQLHHFPTKDSLAIAAIEYAYDQANQKFEKNHQSYQGPDDLFELIIRDFKDFYLSDYFMVALDIIMAGGKNESLRQELVSVSLANRQRIERAWLEKMVDAGWPLRDAENNLALTHSIIRGIAIRTLVNNDTEEFDRMLDCWRQIVAGQQASLSNS